MAACTFAQTSGGEKGYANACFDGELPVSVKTGTMLAMKMTNVAFMGTQITHPRTVAQVSEMVWACLRKNDYAEGTECRVFVEPDGNFYEIRAMAKEPDGPPLRLIDLRIPAGGVDDAEFDALFEENGLAGFRHDNTDSLILGGDPRARTPDTTIYKGQVLPRAGRNDPCPCGSGKKYKRCCLQ